MKHSWVVLFVAVLIGYVAGVVMPGPGASLKTKLGL